MTKPGVMDAVFVRRAFIEETEHILQSVSTGASYLFVSRYLSEPAGPVECWCYPSEITSAFWLSGRFDPMRFPSGHMLTG